MKLNIAITSAGSAPAVAVIKSLRNQNEIKFHITALDMEAMSSGNFLADKWFLIPPANSSDFIKIVFDICKKNNIHCLIPIIDEELFIFAKEKKRFDLAGIKLIVNNKDTIKLARDKYLTYKFCMENNITVPKTFLKKDSAKINRFPVIMKPLDGRGSKDVVKINNKNELMFFKEYYQKYIIQEFIEGREFTIDIVATPKGEILQAIPRQRIAIKAGMSYKGKTVKNERLIKFGKEIARKFKINGPCNIQCIMDRNNHIYLIEVNPKFAAGLPLTVAAGVNIPLILIKFAFGLKVSKKELDFKDELLMLRCWKEIFIPEEDVFT